MVNRGSTTRIIFFLTIVVVGIAVVTSFILAGVTPAQPYQVPSPASQKNNNNFLFAAVNDGNMMMDNPSIEIDMNINPARKCSVCIGVRKATVCVVLPPLSLFCAAVLQSFDVGSFTLKNTGSLMGSTFSVSVAPSISFFPIAPLFR